MTIRQPIIVRRETDNKEFTFDDLIFSIYLYAFSPAFISRAFFMPKTHLQILFAFYVYLP